MDIFVNGSELKFSLQNETLFGPVYTGIAEWAEQGNKKIWSLLVDGTPFQVVKPDVFMTLEIATISRVEVTVGEKDAAKEIAKRVDSFKKNIKEAMVLVDEVIDDIHQGKDDPTQEKWRKILMVINNFHQVLPIFADINISMDKDSMTQSYDEFRTLLKDIQKAQKFKDNVAFCDQLLYELRPQFEKWYDFLTITRSSINKG